MDNGAQEDQSQLEDMGRKTLDNKNKKADLNSEIGLLLFFP